VDLAEVEQVVSTVKVELVDLEMLEDILLLKEVLAERVDQEITE
jgi:hypothetical protein